MSTPVPTTRTARRRRFRAGATVALVVSAAAAAVLAATGFATAAQPPAPTPIPQAELTGTWRLNHCSDQTPGCDSRLAGTNFYSHEKDCNGDGIRYEGLPVNPVENQVYTGRATAAFGENQTCVTTRSTKAYEYTFWRSNGARWVSIHQVGSQYEGRFRHEIGWGGAGGQHCTTGVKAVNRTFRGTLMGDPVAKIFTVQYTNLNYCYDDTNVWFRDNPEARLYIDGSLSHRLQGACAGVSRTDLNNKLPSIYVTCNAVFSNKDIGAFQARSVLDPGDTTAFGIPGSLNMELNLGSLGAVAAAPTADQSRFYTLRIYADGCYQVSGVGDGSSYRP